MKRCYKCGSEKNVAEFYKNRTSKDGLQAFCKECSKANSRQWNASNPERKRKYREEYKARFPRYSADYAARKRAEDIEGARARDREWYRANPDKASEVWRKKHLAANGFTPELFEARLVAQCGACDICGGQFKDARDTHSDHNHTTGAARGILCGACNTMLGLAKESPAVLAQAALYIEKWAAAPVGLSGAPVRRTR